VNGIRGGDARWVKYAHGPMRAAQLARNRTEPVDQLVGEVTRANG
jgi:hypothetical protein